MGKMFKRKSVLYTWCLSYGLLLLMMVVMCIMLGRNARNQLISEYINLLRRRCKSRATTRSMIISMNWSAVRMRSATIIW